MRRSHRPTPSGRDIAGAIRLVLSHDPRVSRFDIRVSVENGIATLMDTVPFLSIQREAEQDAIDTMGVRSVKNRVKVRLESSLSDLDIRNRLLEAWSRDPLLAKFDLAVSVRKGTALLSGRVDSIYERNPAENVSSWIRGVTNLVNQIVFSAPEMQETEKAKRSRLLLKTSKSGKALRASILLCHSECNEESVPNPHAFRIASCFASPGVILIIMKVLYSMLSLGTMLQQGGLRRWNTLHWMCTSATPGPASKMPEAIA